MSDEKKVNLKVDNGASGIKIEEVDAPSNSHKSKTAVQEKKKVPQITKSAVMTKKKSIFSKLTNTFGGEDGRSVGEYVIWDVLMPSAKNTLYEMVRIGFEMLIFGGAQPRGRSTIGRFKDESYVKRGHTPYGKISTGYSREEPRRELSRRSRASHNFDDIIIESRGEAEEVLGYLADLISRYGVASVADLYDLTGITPSHVDNKYGWDSLGGAGAIPVRGGYLLDLPRPIVID